MQVGITDMDPWVPLESDDGSLSAAIQKRLGSLDKFVVAGIYALTQLRDKLLGDVLFSCSFMSLACVLKCLVAAEGSTVFGLRQTADVIEYLRLLSWTALQHPDGLNVPEAIEGAGLPPSTAHQMGSEVHLSPDGKSIMSVCVCGDVCVWV